MPKDQNSTERKAANSKNKIPHAFRLFLSFSETLSEPCLIVCKFLVALNSYFYKRKVK